MACSFVRSYCGDYDGDTIVDDEDYAVWKSTFGSTTELDADGNFNGVVDAADYTVWRDAASSAGGGSLAAGNVPEPGAILLLVTCFVLVGGASRFRVIRRHRGALH